MSRLQQLQGQKGFHTNHNKSSTLPTIMRPPPTSIMKKGQIKATPSTISRPVKVDLSSADKSIRRPSETDLKLENSPRNRPSKATEEKAAQRLSLTKKVMFNVVSDDGESPNEDDSDQVWVLRDDEGQKGQHVVEDDGIPVTGVIVAQPRPCQYANAVKISPIKPVKAAPPPPPPRLTPLNAGLVANNQGQRPANPVLQRPVQLLQFHESPDEGYHEDDPGSEAL